MTEAQARTTANLVMAAAALGAAVLVLRSPKLRRLAWQFARDYSRGPLGAVIATAVRNAWDASAPPNGSAELRRSRDASAPPNGTAEQGPYNIASAADPARARVR